MKVVRESNNIEYKRGFHLTLEDGTSIYVHKVDRGRYQVSGSYGKSFGDKEFEMFFSPIYKSLDGCARYLKKTFGIDLDY